MNLILPLFVPQMRIELMTFRLRNERSTTKLQRLNPKMMIFTDLYLFYTVFVCFHGTVFVYLFVKRL